MQRVTVHARTSVRPPKVEGIRAGNLSWAEAQGISAAVSRTEEARRRRCMLYTLLAGNDDDGRAALAHFVEVAQAALRAEGILPIPFSSNTYDADITDETLGFFARTDSVTHRRAFVVVALYISPRFCAALCPCEPGPDVRFLTDPAALAQALPRFGGILARYVSGETRLRIFVMEALRIWAELEPWATYERWSTYEPGVLSLEARALANAPLSADERRALSGAVALALGAGGAHNAENMRAADAAPHADYYIAAAAEPHLLEYE
jgi:hypothetical protein